MPQLQNADIENRMLQWIGDELLEGQSEGLDVNTPLLELGVITSMSLVSMQAFVQHEFGATIPSTALKPANLETVRKLSTLIASLKTA